jgi:hypothetical protein
MVLKRANGDISPPLRRINFGKVLPRSMVRK